MEINTALNLLLNTVNGKRGSRQELKKAAKAVRQLVEELDAPKTKKARKKTVKRQFSE